MDMYTMEGARALAKSKKKTCCFWTPSKLSGTKYIWIYDPKGTIKEYRQPSKYSIKMVLNKEGKIITASDW